MALPKKRTTQVLEYAFIVIALLLISDALTPILYLGGGHKGVEVSESNPLRLFAALSIYSLALVLLYPRLRLAGQLLLKRPEILAIVLWSLASVFWSGAIGPVFRRAAADTLTVAFCFYVVTRYRPDEFLERLMVAMFIGGCASVALCLLVPSMSIHGGAFTGPWYGAYGHKAILGRACAMAIFTCLILRPTHPTLKKIRIANLFLFGFLVVMSQSRSSWLMLIWGLGAAGLLQILRTRRIEAGLKAGILAFTGVAAITIAVTTFAMLLAAFGRGMDFSGRDDLWRISIMVARDQNEWIGVGYRNFWLGESAREMAKYFTDWARLPGHGHNGYLDTWLELGWVGLTLLLLFIIRGMFALLSNMVKNPHEPAWLLLSVFFLLFVVNNVSATVALRHTDVLWSSSLIGSLYAARYALERRRAAAVVRHAPPPAWRGAAPAPAAARLRPPPPRLVS